MAVGSLAELQAYIQSSLKQQDLLIFCGAGISVAPPASLPAAWPLMQTVRQHFTGSFDHYIRDFELRPEVLFGIINQYEPQHLQQVLSTLLVRGKPNHNHLFCAECLRQGVSVITTNFDQLIEAASINVDYFRSIAGEESEKPLPELQKIHGSIDQPASMLLTINQINHGLSQKRLAALRRLSKGKLILVIGYSGFDQLDIMPALQTCDYRSIIWVNHCPDALAPRASTSNNVWIQALERVQYIDLNTDMLSQHFVSNKLSLCLQPHDMPPMLDAAIQRQICLDILFHHNDYQAVITLQRENPSEDLAFRIATYKARYALGALSTTEHETYNDLLQEILSLPSHEQNTYLATAILYATDTASKALVAGILQSKIADNGLNNELAEALVEYAYKLILDQELDVAEEYLAQVLSYSASNGELLLEARALINLAGAAYYRFVDSGNVEVVQRGIEQANKAVFLLGGDIFNDGFYLHQAINNKAILLKQLGQVEQAINCYRQVIEYYQTRDANNTIHTYYNMAVSYVELGDKQQALACLHEAQSLNMRYERGYLVTHINNLLQELADFST